MSSRSPLLVAASAAFAAAVFSFASPAHAQYQPPPSPGYYRPTPAPREYPGGYPWRTGFTVGVGLGFADLSCDCVADDASNNHLESGSFEFHVGGMLNPRFALLFDGWAVLHVEDTAFGQLFLTQSMGTVAARWWATPMFWLQGGLGWARLSAGYADSDTVDETESRPAAMFAAGYEVLHAPAFAIDIDLRVGSGFYQDATVTGVALGGAVSWY